MPPPTPVILRKLAEIDIAYEVRQYCRWAFDEVLLTAQDQEMLASLQQATFTAGATAMRNLESFFRKERPGPTGFDATDVVADHYFDNGWPRRANLATYPLLLWDDRSPQLNKSAQENVNRHLSHIASTRVTQRGQFSWATDVNRRLILDCYRIFIRDLYVAHPHRVRWFSDATRTVRHRLGNLTPVQNAGATPTQTAVHAATV